MVLRGGPCGQTGGWPLRSRAVGAHVAPDAAGTYSAARQAASGTRLDFRIAESLVSSGIR